ncbi:hypothetical protein CC2G_003826 [Coprinopsis cinerea AmutBmut pab1-1]|nr:hypothetical protein CC2G_003826 [Coprinopsis cinerea AmutBmut pab1-1]
MSNRYMNVRAHPSRLTTSTRVPPPTRTIVRRRSVSISPSRWSMDEDPFANLGPEVRLDRSGKYVEIDEGDEEGESESESESREEDEEDNEDEEENGDDEEDDEEEQDESEVEVEAVANEQDGDNNESDSVTNESDIDSDSSSELSEGGDLIEWFDDAMSYGTEEASEHLDKVLRKWKAGKYTTVESDVLIYVFIDKSAGEGLKGLKGGDRVVAKALLDMAERHDFVVGFSQLDYCVRGEAVDDGIMPHASHGCRACQYEYECDCGSDYEEQEPDVEDISMGEVWERRYLLQGVYDKDGERLPGLPNGDDVFDFDDEKAIVQGEDTMRDIAHDEPADETEYEKGCKMDYVDDPGELEQWWTRRVLVIYPKYEEPRINLELEGGPAAALQRLKKTSWNPPTDEDVTTAYDILTAIDPDKPKLRIPFRFQSPPSLAEDSLAPKAIYLEVLDAATKWEDLELWLSAAERMKFDYSMLGMERLREALEAFEWKEFKARYVLRDRFHNTCV